MRAPGRMREPGMGRRPKECRSSSTRVSAVKASGAAMAPEPEEADAPGAAKVPAVKGRVFARAGQDMQLAIR
eukprot:4513242-Amphidinium_carterae.2